LPIKANSGNISPYQRLVQWLKIHKKYEEPYIAHLRTWGCKAWVWQKVPKLQRTKARAIEGFLVNYDNLYGTIYFVYIPSIRKVLQCADVRFNNRIQHPQPPDEPIEAVAKFNDPTQKKRIVKFAVPESTIIPRQNEDLPKDLPKASTTANVAAILASKSNTAIQTATPLSEEEEDFYNAEEHSEFLINSPTGEEQNLLDFEGSIAVNQPAEQLTLLKN
jgi:hypothetical protein